MRAFGILLAVFVLLACVAGSASLAAATSLEYYGIEDIIDDDMNIRSTITLKFASPISHLEYQLGMKVRNLSASSNFDSADCSIEDVGEKSVVVCDFVGMTKERNLLKLSFVTREGIRSVGDGYKFTVNYGVSLPIERLFVIIKLPENGILAETPVNASFFPHDGRTLSDGKRIGVYWESNNLTTGDDLQYSVTYSMPTIVSVSLIVALTAVVIIAMAGIGFYVRKGSASQPAASVVVTPAVSVLNQDEKRVVDILKMSEGKAGQKHIVREGDFSKAKVSRLVKSLKERGVVDVEPISGRENRIILKLREEATPQEGAAEAADTNKSPEAN
jgi:uncharacterized membrane protein